MIDSPEIVQQEENPLEGAILVHGFIGNQEKPEKEILRKVIKNGTISSPSKRPLDEKDEMRYTADAPWDYSRVTFYAFHGDDRACPNYKDAAAFIAPLAALTGTEIIKPDSSGYYSDQEVAAYTPEGVKIPLEKGLLIIEPFTLAELLPELTKHAQEIDLTAKDYLERYVIVLPYPLTCTPDKIWEIAKARIQPAVNVTYEPASWKQRNGKKATIEELGGEKPITPGEPLTTEVVQYFDVQIDRETKRLQELEIKLKTSATNISWLPDYSIGNTVSPILLLVDENNEVMGKIRELEAKRKKLTEDHASVLAHNQRVSLSRPYL